MSKEMVISANPHETRVAILEEGQLCEYYVEREKEFALVGSIYKGKVTRVLPGMQSAFVEIGLDSDAFLYVSDFLEDLEDFDHVATGDDKTKLAVPAPAAPAALGSGESVEHGSIIPSESSAPESFGNQAAPLADAQPAHYVPSPVVARPSSGAPHQDRPRFENRQGGGRNDRGFNRRGGRNRHGRDRGPAGGRGGRSDNRRFGRELPSSKYAAPRPSGQLDEPVSDFGAAEGHISVLLPGESLAKFREKPAATSPVVEPSGDTTAITSQFGSFEPVAESAPRQPEHSPEESQPAQPYASRAFEQQPREHKSYPPAAPARFRPSSLGVEPLPGESISKWKTHQHLPPEPVNEPAIEAAVSHAPGPHTDEVKEHFGVEEHLGVENDHDAMHTDELDLAASHALDRIASEQAHHEHDSVGEEHHPLAENPPHLTLDEHTAAQLTDDEAAALAEHLAEAQDEEAAHEAAHAIDAHDHEHDGDHEATAHRPETEALATADSEHESDHEDEHDDVHGEELAADGRHDEHHEEDGEGHELHADSADQAHTDALEAVESGEHLESADGQPASELSATSQTPSAARVRNDFRSRMQNPARRGGRDRGGRRDDRNRRPHHGHSGGHGHRHSGPPRKTQLIADMLKQGQEIIVQIAKEPLGKKGARITSHVALPGRFLVYMPTLDHTGVSRKIASAEERARLRHLVNDAKGSSGGGFIVRTAASSAAPEDVRADVEFLTRTWAEIKARSEQKKAPSVLHRDLNLVERILRDFVTPDFGAIWVDSEEGYTKVVDFMSRFQPQLVGRVKLYTKQTPVFEEFGIQQEIDKGLRPKVWLKSGGYIVINHTEALVAIDVNTGKFVGKGSNRLEDTIVRTNVEAVKEIVRQMRLRDLGGIIVIDFIDMEERRNREKVMAALEDALRADRAPSKVLRFNEFGLVAITRKRTKQALERTLCQPCPYCTGSGMVKSIATLCYEIQTEAVKMAPEMPSASLTLRVHPEISKALKTREASLIEELERWTKKSIIIQADPTLHWEQYDIY